MYDPPPSLNPAGVSDHEHPDLSDGRVITELLLEAAALHRDDPRRTGSTVHLPGEGQLIATGDLHDHAPNFARILKLADLGASPDRYLMLHEVIHSPLLVNGKDLSIRTLARIAHLKTRHPAQLVHVLSNHELAQAYGEGISKGGANVVPLFNQGVEFLYPDHAEAILDAVQEYVQTLPLAIRCENGVMLAHSLPGARMLPTFDPTILDRHPTITDMEFGGSAYQMVWGRNHDEATAETLAEAFDARVFVLGHQPAEFGFYTAGDRILVINSDHDEGVVVTMDLANEPTLAQLRQKVRRLAHVKV